MSGPNDAAPARLMSLDAYRGFVMLAMASSGLALSRVANNPEIVGQFDGSQWAAQWQFLWSSLGYQFSHVAWTGCSAWDLIQPSFMFMVGVALPFSASRRRAIGEGHWKSTLHALWRSFLLVLIGMLLSSRISNDSISFIFTNVLCQIGLGYFFLYLLRNSGLRTLLIAIVAISLGYGAWFVFEDTTDGQAAGLPTLAKYTNALQTESRDEAELELTKKHLREVSDLEEDEWSQFQGHAAAWNKHTNAAAEFDRWLLNRLPRNEESWEGRGFWVNRGGYQTLNFIPSLITMLLGLMAGKVLNSERSDGDRLRWLFRAGMICMLVSLAADTTLWPTQWLPEGLRQQFWEYSWSVCPAVKRIWTPTWAVFAAGWTFWTLGLFYWLVDVKGHRTIVFPFAVVGLNSIAMYCMAQLFKGWIGGALRLVASTVDQLAGWTDGLSIWLDYDAFAYAPILDYSLRLFVMWSVCYWMYRKGIYVRI